MKSSFVEVGLIEVRGCVGIRQVRGASLWM